MKRHRVFRGLAVVFGFLCAFLIGLEQVAKVSDYKEMINGVLGTKSSVGGNADAYAFTSQYHNTKELLSARQRVAEQISEEGCVLLKNEGQALPLNSSSESVKKVTVLGSRAYTYNKSGNLRDSTLSFYGGIVGSPIRRQTVTTEEGTIYLPVTVEDGFKNQNIEINPALIDYYSGQAFPNLVPGSEANESHGGPFSVGEPTVSRDNCGSWQNYSDACFVVIGRTSGEGREYFPGYNGVADHSDGAKSAIGLSDNERNLISVANQIAPGKVIVLINSAVAMEIDELKKDNSVNAVLWIGLPGSYGMNGVARVISGAASPSGRLPDTYAVDASASPAAQNFGTNAQTGEEFTWGAGGADYTKNDRKHYVVLAEDIYTGYYYYETRYADCVENKGNASAAVGVGYGETGSETWNYEKEVSYSFGFGLGYATFTSEIVDGSLKANYDSKTVSVDVKVKNNGTQKAKEVIQLYVSQPYTEYDKAHGVEKSAIQLVGFKKVELEGEKEDTFTVTCDMKYFASYDKTAAHDGVAGGYILENAPYYFAIGNGAHEAINNVLAAKGVSLASLYVEKDSTVNNKGAVSWTPALTFDADGVNSALLSTTETGAVVQNQMADTDYNYFKSGAVTYLTRSDWQNTFPVAYPKLEATSAMADFLNSKVYKFKTGTVETPFGVDHSEDEDEEGNPLENLVIAEMKLASYDDERWSYLIEEITFDEAWAFSPYGGQYCNSFLSVMAPEVWQIDGPNGSLNYPLADRGASSGPMAVDKKDVNAGYIAADMCCEPMVAATFNQELLEEQGKMFGEDLLWNNHPIIWAPGMNLHRTPFNSRNHEYYSEDPMLTNLMGKAFITGGLSKGGILAAKHFAFNTQESYREGLIQFMEEQSARELELRGFQCIGTDIKYKNELGNEIGALGIMTSFSRVGVCGVNAHEGVMKNILRKEWGFRGLSSTDMVVGANFFNPQDSVINNVTFMATSNADNLLKTWTDYSNKSKVKNDPALCAALAENMHYYMYAIANSSALNGIDASTTFGETVYGWQIAIKALYWVSFVISLAFAGLYVYFNVRKKKAAAPPAGDSDGPQSDTKENSDEEGADYEED